MLLRYTNLTLNKADTSAPEDKVCILTFRSGDAGISRGLTLGAAASTTSSLQLALTESEASAYTLGNEYELALPASTASKQ